VAIAAVIVAIAGGAGAAPAAAAAPGLTLTATEISVTQTVSISYDATGVAGAKNWVGLYRHGQKPGGGTSSLDWRYAPNATGTFTWGPNARDGWTKEAASIAPGDLDVYLFANDGYTVIAGPVALRVTVVPAQPKPPVDGRSQLNVLTLNLWKGGTAVKDGLQRAADAIEQVDADVAFLPERLTPSRVDTTPTLAAALGYQHVSATDTGVVSRYPIVSTTTVGTRWTKVVIDVNGTEVAVYGGHLEYRWYAEYLPRGYGPTAVGDWPTEYLGGAELPAPVTDVPTMLAMNEQSGRPDSARELLADVNAEKRGGRQVVVGGDFNEPSSQDWVESTKQLFDHRGTVVPWQTTKTLLDGGLVDSYRAAHPDPVKNPGFTWPAGNPDATVGSLTWAPKADERDRIDYVFFAPSSRLTLTSSEVVGPRASIVRSQRVDDDSTDAIITPVSGWPSDHKGVLSTFTVCAESCEPTTPTEPTTGDEALTVSGAVRVGGAVKLHGTGFVPGATAVIELHSTPLRLGTAVADANGVLALSATIPASVTAGAHTVVALVDGVEAARLPVQVAPAADDGGAGPGPGTDPDPGPGQGPGEQPEPGPGGSGEPGPAGPADGGSSGAGPAVTTTGDGELASTGVDVIPGALIAVIALCAGVALIVGRRRTTRAQ
jgi:endonuclease/exonuclease/phosphatase family metal-dependent hydrolase